MDHKAIIKALGGWRKASQKLDMPVQRVRFWERRNSIPPEYFSAVSTVAQREGLDWVTEKHLLETLAARVAAPANRHAASALCAGRFIRQPR